MKLSGALHIDHNKMRTRAFSLGGQEFKVRVPLASEMEEINNRVNAIDFSAKFAEMIKPLQDKRELLESEDIQFIDDDAIVNGKSIKDLSKMTVQTEQRIVEMVRLLIPADEGFDMSNIEYSDINAEFPFAIQLQLMKKIMEVISPGYEEIRKN